MKILAALVILMAAAMQPGTALAQAPAPQKLVLNVTDSTGRYVQGLRGDDFILEADGVEQKIQSFIPDSTTPLSFGLLIDKSTSMRLPLQVEGREPMPAALLAAAGFARAFVRLMKPTDEFQLMTFDDGLQVKQAFTQDKKKLDDQLYKLHEVGGSTHLYESIVKALEKMDKAKYKRRALIVITDAYDTSGKALEEMQARFGKLEIPIYIFGLRAIFEGQADQDLIEPLFQLVLSTISKETGGLSYVVAVPEFRNDATITGMVAFAAVVALELRGQYTISYSPVGPAPALLRVRIKTTQDMRVRIRPEAEPVPANAKKK